MSLRSEAAREAYRHFLDGFTLQEIADHYGLTRESVRQLVEQGQREARADERAVKPFNESVREGAKLGAVLGGIYTVMG